jgi:hypothetical protein
MDELSISVASPALRYLGNQWSASALNETCAMSATADFDWATLAQFCWPVRRHA